MIAQQVRSIIDELEALGKTRGDAWQVPAEEGILLYHIALAARCRVILEVGTSYGFSGLFWGAALRQTGGRLHTIDVDPEKWRSAQETFKRVGLAEQIICHLGDAHSILPMIAGPIDLAFLDADKASTRAYLDLVWPKLATGGSVITDNTVTHRDELADFIGHVRCRPDASSLGLTVGNGMEWTVKTA